MEFAHRKPVQEIQGPLHRRMQHTDVLHEHPTEEHGEQDRGLTLIRGIPWTTGPRVRVQGLPGVGTCTFGPPRLKFCPFAGRTIIPSRYQVLVFIVVNRVFDGSPVRSRGRRYLRHGSKQGF